MKIVYTPGFQQGNETIEYQLLDFSCERMVTNFGRKNPVSRRETCHDLERTNSIHKWFMAVDWKVMQRISQLNTVDDVDLYTFMGDFGRISLPLAYWLAEDKIEGRDRDVCRELLDMVSRVEKLHYT